MAAKQTGLSTKDTKSTKKCVQTSCGAAEESSPGREPGVGWEMETSSGGAAERRLPLLRSLFGIWRAQPTAHAVGYCPSHLGCSESGLKTLNEDSNLFFLSALRALRGWRFFICVFLLTSLPVRAAITNITATRTTMMIRGDAQKTGVRLFALEPWESPAVLGNRSPLATVPANKPLRVDLARRADDFDRIYSGFILCPMDSTAPLGPVRYVEKFDGVALWDEPFPQPASKKGLQVQMVEDALVLGVKHAALNLYLGGWFRGLDGKDVLEWTADGQTYRFNRQAVEGLDRQVKRLSDAGVVVNLIVLAGPTGDPAVDRWLVHPNYSPKAPNKLAAFNTSTEEGFRHFRALFEFLGARYSRPEREFGRIVGFIMSNEVNSHWDWSNMGSATMEQFADDYLRATRTAWTALQQFAPASRVYLSLEHHWNIPYRAKETDKSFAARPFLEYMNARAKEGGDFPWHVAFHPYPENLFEPRFWNDKTATPDAATKRVTFKNLPVLTEFFRRVDLSYAGKPRRIILSEQGFHTPNGADGEAVQAAAYAYAYRLVERESGIDSFILHRHVDHRGEGGLLLGLWSNKPGSIADPDRKKPIYDVFKAADTAEWRKAFDPSLKIIGLEKWPGAE